MMCTENILRVHGLKGTSIPFEKTEAYFQWIAELIYYYLKRKGW